MTARSNCYKFFEGFLIGGASAVIGFTTAHLINKLFKHDDEIEELFSRLEECEKIMNLHKIHELKK